MKVTIYNDTHGYWEVLPASYAGGYLEEQLVQGEWRVEELPDSHFIHGWLENLLQSDNCPYWDAKRVKFEH